jgi:predicted acyltransferase
MTTDAATIEKPKRIASLDEVRGYAIFGMLLVNFFGHYKTEWIKVMEDSALKEWLMWIFGVQLEHHGEYMTYADTIAPLFMFVVGIGLRLSWLRRAGQMDAGLVRKATIKRFFTLVLIAFAIYQGWLWDALMSIGLAGLVAVWIVDRKPVVRIIYALGVLAAYQLVFSTTSYGEWLLRMGSYGRELDWPFITTFIPLRGDLLDCAINGGLIGHWGWAFMLIFGTIAYDIMATRDRTKVISGLLACGLALTVAGWGVSAVGTKAYYKKAEPYAAACMLEGDFGVPNRIFGKSPGIFTAFAKDNPDALEALEKRDLNKFSTLMQNELEAIAAPDTYVLSVQTRAALHMKKREWGPASGLLKAHPDYFTEIVAGNDEAAKALEATDSKALGKALGEERVREIHNTRTALPRLGNAWVFSKNYVTMPFAFWATALGFFTLLAFYIVCDLMKLSVPGMRVIGQNPFFIYIFQSLTLEVYSQIQDLSDMQRTESALVVFGSFVIYFGLVYAMAFYFYKKKIYIKI